MRSGDLRSLLDDVPDTREIVLRRDPAWSPVLEVWRDASEEAAAALKLWRSTPGDFAYVVYRAAQDREDAAQDALAHSDTSGKPGMRGRTLAERQAGSFIPRRP